MKRIILILAIVLAVNALAAACPNCKGLEQVLPPSSADSQAGGLPTGFNKSIYFMLGGLFVVISAVATLIVKAVRDTNKTRDIAPQH